MTSWSSWSHEARGTRWLRLMMALSRWLGVSPPTENYRKIHFFWSLVLLGCVWIATMHRLITMRFHRQLLTIQKMFYFAEYPANLLMTALFSLRIFRSTGFYRQIWMQLQRQQMLLFENAGEAQELYSRLGHHVLRWLLVILIYHGICILVDSAWLDFDWRRTIPSNCAHNLPSTMISLSLLQYVVAQRLLASLAMQLNKRVEQLNSRSFGTSVELRLEQLRLTSVALDELQINLLNRFGLVLLINFINSLLSFSYEIFNMFRLLELAQSGDWVLYCYRSLWLLLHGSRVWLILKANERIVEQKCQMSLLLNKLDASDEGLERCINRFLLQIQACESQPLAVCGVVDLDTLTLGGFINALMAIVIFLIQIDLGNKSLMGYA